MNDESYIVYHCKKCGWKSEPKPTYAMAQWCPGCSKYGLSFVTWNHPSEDSAAAERLRQEGRFDE
jgi:ribosomal protein L44E